MVDGEKIAGLLGQAVDSPEFIQTVGAMGLKVPASFSKSYKSEIVWNAKQSIRFDMFRSDHYAAITGTQPQGDWLFGLVRFMAAGNDDRVKKDYSGTLPFGITFGASPEECIAILGEPNLVDEVYGDITLYAWVKDGKNLSIEFEGDERMVCVSMNIRGTEETWADTWPEIYAA